MALRTREISQAWAQRYICPAWVPSAQGVDVPPNSPWLPGRLPFHQDEDPLGSPQVWGPRRSSAGCIPLPHCQGTFNFKGSNTFFFCVLFLKDSLFLISSWQTGTSRAAHSCQDWDHEISPVWIPFSDPLQWPFQLCPSYAGYWMLSGPLKIVICLASFLLSFFFLLQKAALYEDI